MADETLKVRYKYSVTRKTYNEKMLPTISMEPSYVIEKEDRAIREALVNMLEGDESAERLLLPTLFPKFLKVTEGWYWLVPRDNLLCHTQLTGEKRRQRIKNYSPTDERQTVWRQWGKLHRRKCIPKHIAANAFNEKPFDHLVGGVGSMRWSHLRKFICQTAARWLYSQFGAVHIERQIVPGNIEYFHGRRVSWVIMWRERFLIYFLCDSASSEFTQRLCSLHREFSDQCSREAVPISCSANCPMLTEYFSCAWTFTWWV